jgi:aldose 1-epimerase
MRNLQESSTPPSGEQYAIGHGHQQAVVTEVGASLRSYRVADMSVIDGYETHEMCSGGRGQVLAPWPNRLGDGRYVFDACHVQAALDEPAHRNAIHGLVRWLPWQLESRAQNVVALACVLHPQPGYPWRLALRVEYRLGRDGLTVNTTVTNADARPAPFGLGFHPYVTVDTDTIDLARLTVPARRRLVTDQRGLPVDHVTVSGTEYDFASGRVIGASRLDTAYSELRRDGDGVARVEIDDPIGGRAVTLWMDERFRYVMVFTGDTLAADRRRRSIAIEPMTCPPDALRSGTDLVRLEPGVTWGASWGITAR